LDDEAAAVEESLGEAAKFLIVRNDQDACRIAFRFRHQGTLNRRSSTASDCVVQAGLHVKPKDVAQHRSS
jgi:hypothetical protein